MIIDAKAGFTFGCDPEVFIRDADGNPVSAAEAGIPGTKAEPFLVECGAVQRDGMAAEFNIDPVSTFAEFNRNIEKVMEQLTKMLPTGFTIDVTPSVRFPMEAFDKTPDEDKVLGCTPDFNAWTGEINPPPSPEMIGDPFLRTAAGHLHFGWTKDADLGSMQHVLNCRDLVRQLDWYLGAWSITMDKDATRRSLYGKAGACRYKDYGVEYRVLSNFWITTRARRLAVWNRMQQAVIDMQHGFMPERAKGWYQGLLVESINTSTKCRDLESAYHYPIRSLDPSYVR